MRTECTSTRACEIAIVEDAAAEAELATVGIRQSCPGCKITLFRDGDELLNYLAPNDHGTGIQHLRLVLLDLKLVRVHGLDVLRTLKRDIRTRAIPIVVVTSSSLPRDVQSAYDMGANSYVVKPIDYDEYRRVIGEVVHYWTAVNETMSPP